MKLAFREFGSGQPLIILHGLFGQSDNWNTLAKNFGEKGFHVFTLDQRNHGLSPHSDEWSYEAMADDLKEFIDDHQLKSPILLGHSMGAKTVMFFELMYPRIAAKLVIADMAARAYEGHHQDVLAALHAVDFDIIKNRKEAEAVMDQYIKDFGTKQFLLKNIYWKDAENNRMDWRFNLKVISDKYDNVSVAVPFAVSIVPTLVIGGERSHYINQKDVEDFKLRFPNAVFETVAGAAHWVHAEKPKEFFETVLRFITN
jgi:pimeloyl-ACP methyl ester carboxylesterase